MRGMSNLNVIQFEQPELTQTDSNNFIQISMFMSSGLTAHRLMPSYSLTSLSLSRKEPSCPMERAAEQN